MPMRRNTRPSHSSPRHLLSADQRSSTHFRQPYSSLNSLLNIGPYRLMDECTIFAAFRRYCDRSTWQRWRRRFQHSRNVCRIENGWWRRIRFFRLETQRECPSRVSDHNGAGFFVDLKHLQVAVALPQLEIEEAISARAGSPRQGRHFQQRPRHASHGRDSGQRDFRQRRVGWLGRRRDWYKAKDISRQDSFKWIRLCPCGVCANENCDN